MLALIGTRNPLGNGNAIAIDNKVEEGNARIAHLPNDGAFPSEKGVKRVFNLDNALVAGIINSALATVATVSRNYPPSGRVGL